MTININGIMLTIFNILTRIKVCLKNGFSRWHFFHNKKMIRWNFSRQMSRFWKKAPIFKLCHFLFWNNRYLRQHLKEFEEIVSTKLKLAVDNKEISKQNLQQAQNKLMDLEIILNEVFVIFTIAFLNVNSLNLIGWETKYNYENKMCLWNTMPPIMINFI